MDGKKIMVVDDDEILLETFQLVLQGEGYTVETATTGRQALEKAENTRYDLVILDIKLPDIMGDKVARMIRSRDKQIAIIVITGFPSLQESIKAIDVGIHEILLKPIKPEILIDVIREAFSEE